MKSAMKSETAFSSAADQFPPDYVQFSGCHCTADLLLSDVNPMMSSRNCTLQQSSVNCQDQFVCMRVSLQHASLAAPLLPGRGFICMSEAVHQSLAEC